MPQNRQFSLRFLMVIITVLCTVLFLAFNGSTLIHKVALVVLVVNGLGFFAAQIVTHVFGFPRDGS